MCGIAGIAALGNARSPVSEQVKGMCGTIVHRGPDEEGIEVRDGVALGMRRLSIIDLAGGSQPIAGEDGRVRVVFNGEIYNFRELRRDLEARGHRFATRSDTEVIVHAYEEHGSRCVEHLNGMFGFALHDSARRKLLLARDHLGIKPLFYALTPHYVVWGSEIKALLASGLLERELDVDALGQLLAWEYVPGDATLLRSVRKLPPGHILEVDLGSGRSRRSCYWDVPVPDGQADAGQDDGEWLEAVDAKLHECVQRQLVSDVPLGAFLSGGVDSSLVVAAMGRATTFSIGFEDRSYNELAWSRRVADYLGVEHHTEVIRPSVRELFDHLLYFLDEPIGDFSIFPTYLVSRLARSRVTVALSGDGGDELFGGYETYAADRWARLYGRAPGILRRGLVEPLVRSLPPTAAKKGAVNKARRFVEGLEHAPELGHARWRLFCGTALREALFTPEARARMETPVEHHVLELSRRAAAMDPLSRSLYVDLKSYLCDNILVKVDRMSMATSLEARVPFLDRELVELAFRVPPHLKLQRGRTKVLLKRAAARHVPAECVYRRKEGFSIPIKQWLGSEFRPLMEELLEPARLRGEGLFDAGCVEHLMREHLRGDANHSHVLWTLMVFQAWRDRWLDG